MNLEAMANASKNCKDCKNYLVVERARPKPHWVGVCSLHKQGPYYLHTSTVRGYLSGKYCGPDGRNFIEKNEQKEAA